MKIFDIYYFSAPLWILLGFFGGAILIYFLFIGKAQENFSQIELIKSSYRKSSFWYKIYMFLIICISFLFVIGLAQPIQSGTQKKVKKNGVDIEIVFDVSYSMIAEDIFPSRIEAAKQVFSDFVGGLNSDRVGLILFAGKPFQSVPLSYDYNFLRQFIREMSVETIDQQNNDLQGTALGDALVLASGVLVKEENKREKVIILITDGEANRGIKPEIALRLLKENDVKTYAIGVGKDAQTTIDIVLPGGFVRQTPVGGLDEEILKKIARETGGKYFRADSPETFEEILDTIGKLEKKEDEFIEYQFHTSMLYIVMWGMLFPFLGILFIVFFKKVKL